MIRWPFLTAIEEMDRNYRASYLRDMAAARPRSARMVSWVAHLLTAVGLVCVFTTPAAAQGSVPPVGVPAYTATPKRIVASGAAVTGLIGAPYLLWLIARGNRKGSDG